MTKSDHKTDPFLILRGVAAVSVILWHISPPRDSLIISGINLSWVFFPSGIVAVWAFFALSGYLMGKVFFTGKYNLSKKGLLKFYFSRIKSIVPLYYLNIAFCAIFLYLPIVKKNPQILTRLITFTANNFLILDGFNTPVWALSVIFQFYLLVPLFYLLAKSVYRKKHYLLSILFLIAFSTLYRHYFLANYSFWILNNWIKYIYTNLIGCIDIFLVPFFLNRFLIDNNKTKQIKFVNKKTAVIFLSILYLSGNYFSMNFFQSYTSPDKYMITLIFPIITYLSISYFIFAFESKKYLKTYQSPKIAELINSLRLTSLFEIIGIYSFGIYIWHKPILEIFNIMDKKLSLIGSYFTLFLTLSISLILTFATKYITVKIHDLIKKNTVF